MTLPDRFWAKTTRSDCIVWVAAQNSRGYGCISVGGVVHLAHRLAYEDAYGPIPAGMTIDHLCRNRACVNVDHLEVVTYQENTRRALTLAVGRQCRKGHEIESEADLYRRANGKVECLACRREKRREARRAAAERVSA